MPDAINLNINKAVGAYGADAQRRPVAGNDQAGAESAGAARNAAARNAAANGNAAAARNAAANGNAATKGNAAIKGNATANGNAATNGNADASGNAAANGNKAVSGDAAAAPGPDQLAAAKLAAMLEKFPPAARGAAIALLEYRFPVSDETLAQMLSYISQPGGTDVKSAALLVSGGVEARRADISLLSEIINGNYNLGDEITALAGLIAEAGGEEGAEMTRALIAAGGAYDALITAGGAYDALITAGGAYDALITAGGAYDALKESGAPASVFFGAGEGHTGAAIDARVAGDAGYTAFGVGANGVNGADGAAGTVGANGVSGKEGEVGASGSDGMAGEVGAIGSGGATGTVGANASGDAESVADGASAQQAGATGAVDVSTAPQAGGAAQPGVAAGKLFDVLAGAGLSAVIESAGNGAGENSGSQSLPEADTASGGRGGVTETVSRLTPDDFGIPYNLIRNAVGDIYRRAYEVSPDAVNSDGRGARQLRELANNLLGARGNSPVPALIKDASAAQEDIKNYYAQALCRAGLLRAALRQSERDTPLKTEIYRQLDRITDGARLINEINNRHQYAQLPVFADGKESGFELFVMKRGGKKKKLDAEDATLFLSLGTENIGRVEALLHTGRNKSVSLDIRAESERELSLLKEGCASLRAALAEKGRRLSRITFRVIKEKLTAANAVKHANEIFQYGGSRINYKI